MKKKNLVPLQYFVPLSLFFLFAFVSLPVFGVGKTDNVSGKATTVQEKRRQPVQNRLTAAKLKACQAKENAIKKQAERLGELATNMQEKFDAIAKRVEEYYTERVVPSGKTVANYDSLLAEIQTKKSAVQTALSKAQNNVESFTCDNNDPKGQLGQFKDDMREVKTALKDYRTSIKNLIVAVHSVGK